jgi:hypothetical protein
MSGFLLLAPSARAGACPNIGGPWTVSGSISMTLSAQGQSRHMNLPVASGQTIYLDQNGCSFSYTLSTTSGGSDINVTYHGTISDGGLVTIRGQTPGELEFLGGSIVHFTGTVVADGPLSGSTIYLTNGSYSASTSYEGIPITMTGKPDLVLQSLLPLVSITSPAAGAILTNTQVTLEGGASASAGVEDVYYQINGGSWMEAWTDGDWTDWSTNVTLSPGSNTISAMAVDLDGTDSAITSVECFCAVTTPLEVLTNGSGTVSSNYNKQWLVIGKNYSMTATAAPGSGFAFANWTGGTNLPFSVLTNKPRLTFTMASNLTLAANFVDVAPPGISISLPARNGRWSNSIFTASGTAKDNVQVSNVWCQLNSSGWTLAAPGNTNWTNWTATLAPLKSANVFQAYSIDTSGNVSPTNTVSFLYVPSASLIAVTNGAGGITLPGNGGLLAIGTNYTVKASPGANWLFSNWVGGTALPYSVLSTSSNYTFAMQSNLVLQANFVTNPFLAVAGVYSGLFYPTNGVTEGSSGFISVAIATNSKGACTGKLLLDGGSNSFSGSFDLTGTAHINVARRGKTPVSVTLNLDFNRADARMGGSVSDETAGWNSVIEADRAVFSATGNPAANYAGQFTLLFPPDTNAPAGSPDGYGCAAMTNTPAGNSMVGGSLADGTPFVWSAPIAGNGRIPVYQSLYSGKGSVLGWIYLTNEPPQEVTADSWVSWIKLPISRTLYPSGFTNRTGVLGSPYTNTARTGGPVLNLTNATLVLRNGNLTGGALTYTNIGTDPASRNMLTNLDAGNANLSPTNHLVIAINTNNGLVTVTFQETGVRTTNAAHGAVLQNQTNAAGYFLGTNETGAFILSPN